MRERRLARRAAGACAAVMAVGLVVGAPVALAQVQPDPDLDWAGSQFDAPFTTGTTVDDDRFAVGGVFQFRSPTIRSVVVDFGKITSGFFDTADDDQCVPTDIADGTPSEGQVDDSGADASGNTWEFDVAPNQARWTCNGRYAIQATASAGVLPPSTKSIVTRITIAVPPKPVAVAEAKLATTEDDGRVVAVDWEPLEGQSQLVGYRVERAGPKVDDAYGAFESVGPDLDPDTTEFTDDDVEAGDHRYRVRALRFGADGPIASPVTGTGVADITVDRSSTSSTTSSTTPVTNPDGTPTTIVGPAVPDLGPAGTRSTTPITVSGARPAVPQIGTAGPPTTIDTGFEGELDYGDRPLDDTDDVEPGELASGGEGQSIINSDDDAGAGLVIPIAGALVLVGWAGHVGYLNRLAKQF